VSATRERATESSSSSPKRTVRSGTTCGRRASEHRGARPADALCSGVDPLSVLWSAGVYFDRCRGEAPPHGQRRHAGAPAAAPARPARSPAGPPATCAHDSHDAELTTRTTPLCQVIADMKPLLRAGHYSLALEKGVRRPAPPPARPRADREKQAAALRGAAHCTARGSRAGRGRGASQVLSCLSKLSRDRSFLQRHANKLVLGAFGAALAGLTVVGIRRRAQVAPAMAALRYAAARPARPQSGVT
jgi:hypothetical protein